MESKIFQKVSSTCSEGTSAVIAERIVKESALTINVDGRHFATAIMLAALEKEFVFGHLYAQGIINRAADIASCMLHKDTAEVILKPERIKKAPSEKVTSNLIVPHEDVFNCVRAILKSEVFTETEAVHSAGLFLEGKETVCIAEDLGRHHALDKVIGAGLLQGVDFSRILAASTGRQPSEMIYKCRAAGIPIIATKGVPTALAVSIAEKAGITIAGLVRGKTMIVYSHPERIG
jgi:FdhD protein